MAYAAVTVRVGLFSDLLAGDDMQSLGVGTGAWSGHRRDFPTISHYVGACGCATTVVPYLIGETLLHSSLFFPGLCLMSNGC